MGIKRDIADLGVRIGQRSTVLGDAGWNEERVGLWEREPTDVKFPDSQL